MRAVTFSDYRQPPRLVDVPSPACPADGVVIDVRAAGLCRSDWHAWCGHEDVALPHIPGHEFAGVVAEVGRDVRRWTAGDRVTVPFVLGCGVCDVCAAGNAQVCPEQRQPGFTDPGCFAEQVAVPRVDFNLVALPDDLGFITAASLGCRFATAFHALTRHGDAPHGKWVAVHGCGGVGLSAVMIANALGGRAVAVDISDAALALARDFGAVATVNARLGETAAAVVSATGGGAHVSLDATGRPGVTLVSVASLRPRGRHVQVGLLHGAAAQVALPMDLMIAQELEVHGSHGMAACDYPDMLDLVRSGKLRPELLVRSVITLPAVPQALMALDDPAAAEGITVIDITAG